MASSIDRNAQLRSERIVVRAPWVDVNKALPPDNQEVIIWHVLGDGAQSPHTMDFAHWINGKWILPWKGAATWVKAWMFPPEKPEWVAAVSNSLERNG